MERWKGRVAVVTGASAGIGADIAKRLALEGLQVVGLARRKERIEKIAKTLPQHCKGRLIAIKCSVSEENEVKEAFDWIEKNLGGVAVMVNNAGLVRNVTFDGTNGTIQDWQSILDTNVLGLSICTKYALMSMKKHKNDYGHFININSVAGHTFPFDISLSMYYASKHAVTVLTDALRKEVTQLKTKIRVTSISPGYVKTEIIQGHELTPQMSEFLKDAPNLESEHITSAVIYVLSAPPIVNVIELTIKPTGEFF